MRALVAVLAARDAIVDRYERAVDDRGGASVEQVILIAAFATMALAAAVIITAKVTSKANRIPTD